MSELTDEQLIEIYALNCDCEGTRVMLNGLRAVYDAAAGVERALCSDLCKQYSVVLCASSTRTHLHSGAAIGAEQCAEMILERWKDAQS